MRNYRLYRNNAKLQQQNTDAIYHNYVIPNYSKSVIDVIINYKNNNFM